MSGAFKSGVGIARQIKLPNREAVKIALRSLRMRFWRSSITMAGIVLGIAFLTFVMTAGRIERVMKDPDNGGRDGARPSSSAVPEAAAQERATQIWLIAISLVVCGVGITNAMLMSVTERFREIGTMKCLGALDWFVVKLFLFEAVFLGIAGSLIGGIVGTVAAILSAMTQYSGVLTQMPWGATLQSFAVAVAVGGMLSMIGAIYPARRAGKMPPADAMRTEI